MDKPSTFTIHGELVSLNKYIDAERSNRFMGAKIKKEQTRLVEWEIKSSKMEPIEGKCDFVFTWRYKNRKQDPDNISFAQKFIFDALVKQGIIGNDGWAEVGTISHFFEVDKEPSITVKISERHED